MTKKYILVMNMWKFVIISVLYFSSCSCYPAKPLNERSPDLTWEAWLLVDDQNQHKQLPDGVLRRRITPKSVFIAPTFSPESLPACAEGYSSDPLGRCVRMIKLDESAHYNFLIEKLNDKFKVDYDYYDEEEQTTGPYQVNIPLGVQNDETIEESDVAIVVSPTKPQFIGEHTSNVGKRDDVIEQKLQEDLLKHLVKTTTMPEPTTQKITTAVTEITDLTTESTDSTVTDGTILTETTMTSDFTVETRTTTVAPKVDTLAPLASESNIVRFPNEPETSNIRFPSDDDARPSQIPPPVNHHNPRAIPESRQSDDFIRFDDSTSRVQEETLNRRNREKSLFFLPPRWTDSNYQRPVVLRFSRKHAYLDMEQFKKPNYYRSIPTDDFAYLFKFKHKQSDQSSSTTLDDFGNQAVSPEQLDKMLLERT